MLIRGSAFLPLVLLGLLAVGCGGPRIHPVEGKVTFSDGVPVSGGIVEFEAQDPAARGRNARGLLQPDGSYRLTTVRGGDGALEGEHRVVVVPTPPVGGKGAGGHIIPIRYSRYETSGLSYTVRPGGNRYDIKIELP